MRIGATVLALLVSLAGCSDASGDQASPSPDPTTPAPAVLWSAAGRADFALDDPISEEHDGKHFRPPAHWTVVYDYNCSMYDERQRFDIDAHGDVDNGALVDEIDWKGHGSVDVDGEGTHAEWLIVDTHCAWHAKAVARNE